MAKNPPETHQVAFDDVNGSRQVYESVNITNTSFTNVEKPSHFDQELPDLMESSLSDTVNHPFCQADFPMAGGPPGGASIFGGAHTMLSWITDASVVNDMTSTLSEGHSFDEDFLTHFMNEAMDSPSEDSDDHSVDDNLEVWHRLRSWCHEHHVGRDAMSELLLIFKESGHGTWPKDWRTALSRLSADDLLKNSGNEGLQASITHVCGACF